MRVRFVKTNAYVVQYDVLPIQCEAIPYRFPVVKVASAPFYVPGVDIPICLDGLERPIPYEDFKGLIKESGQVTLDDLTSKFRERLHAEQTVRLIPDEWHADILDATFRSKTGKSGKPQMEVLIQQSGGDTTLTRYVQAVKQGLREREPDMITPVWPSRKYKRYKQLIQYNIKKVLQSGDIWIDVGCGDALAAQKVAKDKTLEVAGVNLHRYPQYEAVPETLSHPFKHLPNIWMFHAKLPEDLILYSCYLKRAKFVTDVYSAVSYCRDPLAVLIYEAALLKPKAKAVVVTEVERFGEVKRARSSSWKRIQKFFHQYSGQKVECEPFWNFADANQRWERTLRVVIEGEGRYERMGSRRDPFATAMKLAGQVVGSPHRRDDLEPLFETADKLARIWRVDYG